MNNSKQHIEMSTGDNQHNGILAVKFWWKFQWKCRPIRFWLKFRQNFWPLNSANFGGISAFSGANVSMIPEGGQLYVFKLDK